MKIFSTAQVALLDKFTIENEPVSADDLMERASAAFVDCLLELIPYEGNIQLFCGPGNNGGDGLVIARLLSLVFPSRAIEVYLLDLGKGFSPSIEVNLKRLQEQRPVVVTIIRSEKHFPVIIKANVVIDALFGSGLTRPLSGLAGNLVRHINHAGATVYAVDIPSGLLGEDNLMNNPDHIINAAITISFQFPKLSFLLPENADFVGEWKVVPIGLHQRAIDETPPLGYLLTKEAIQALIKPRKTFSHKGTYGYALLIAGSYGRMGAAILASKACLRSGVGLLTAHVPHNCYQLLQTAVPEAMCSIDDSDLMYTSISDLKPYSAVGIGPAISTKVNAQRGFRRLIKEVKVPLVIDADGLTILSQNPDWMNDLPEDTILTPHPKEFDRLAGASLSGYERLQKAIEMAKKYSVNIVLKGAYTQMINVKGEVFFNSTGNPGMATAGSGDVLMGIVLAWLAQGYDPEEAMKIAVYVHGLAGDKAAEKVGQVALVASDIVDCLSMAYMYLAELPTSGK
jgi:NAD(P)H-hydrate epimerase